MNRLTINLEALQYNIQVIDGWMKHHKADWTLVTKVLCGHRDALRALQTLGVRSMADSRLANLEAIRGISTELETWYLRLPHLSAIPRIVELSDVSLNSEIDIILALNREAKKQDRVHRIIVMVELGDLREGILPGGLIQFYNNIFELPNIEVLGIGANLGCLSGAVPSVDQLTQLVLYRELLELKFKRRLPMVSAGSSATLPLLLKGQVPKQMNHFRIGESVFLGSDLVTGDILPGLRDDAITLEAEIVEIKEKSLVPMGETSSVAPFESLQEEDPSPGQRGYRAIVTVGQLDTEVSGLVPIDPSHQLAGASSDLTVVNLGPDPGVLEVGDSIQFRPNYAAMVRLMGTGYIDKVLFPSFEKFDKDFDTEQEIEIPRVLDSIEESGEEEEQGEK